MPSNNEKIELVFDNLLADQLAASRLYYRSTVFWKLGRIVAVILACVGTYLTWKEGLLWWTLIWFPLAVGEWFNVISLRPLQIWWWCKHNPKFLETYHLTFSPVGIQFRTESIDSLVKWTHYTHMLEDDRLCLLVYGSHLYSVIPKRVFGSEATLDQFRALVTECLGPRHGSA